MIKEVVTKEIAAAAAKRLLDRRSKPDHFEVDANFEATAKALEHHLRSVENWSSQVSLDGLPHSRSLRQVFVPQRFQEWPGGRKSSVKIEELLTLDGHIALLGHPGAGKTTIVRRLCQYLLHEEGTDRFSFPVLVRLSEVPTGQSLVDYLIGRLGIGLTTPDKGRTGASSDKDRLEFIDTFRRCLLIEFLEAQPVCLLLDGLDEVTPDAYGPVVMDIRALASELTAAKILLTCRIGSLNIALGNTSFLSVAPLNNVEILTFLEKWFESPEKASEFLIAVKKTPYADTIGRPLILTFLCMLFEGYGELPDQPSLIYQRIIQLLLEDWDRQRLVKRGSRYERFGAERKRQFLAAISWELTAMHPGTLYKDQELRSAYSRVCARFDLPEDERDIVVQEIESHSGLLLRAGYQFEFGHKSLQEYLCADYVSRATDLAKIAGTLATLPNECAIATVIAAEPGDFFSALAAMFESSKFWVPYLTRLAVEGATFTPRHTVGLDILRVASLGWTALPSKTHRLPDASPLEHLLVGLVRRSKLERAVNQAQQMYRIVAGELDFVHLQAVDPERLPTAFPERLVVDRLFLQF